MHQIKYLGLLENVRVRRAGFAYRQYFELFLKRYKYCSPLTFPRPYKGTDQQACEAILKHCSETIPATGWQSGVTKLFIKEPAHVAAMEVRREEYFNKLVRRIQITWSKFKNSKDSIQLKRNIDKTYAMHSKERRTDSVFRPMQGQYLDHHQLSQFHNVINYDPTASQWTEHYHLGRQYWHNKVTEVSMWIKPEVLNTQRVLFADKVQQLNTDTGELDNELLIITNRALYLVARKSVDITKRSTGKHKSTRKSKGHDVTQTNPINTTIEYSIVKKKLSLATISGLSLSCHADMVLAIHTYPTAIPDSPCVIKNKDAFLFCSGCYVKFSKGGKFNCKVCGNVYCEKTCLVHQRPFPTLGFTTPIAVCVACYYSGEPYEAQGDLVLWTNMKTEVAAVLRRYYRLSMHTKLPLLFTNQIVVHPDLTKPKTVHITPGKKDCVVEHSQDVIKVHSSVGITQAKIDSINMQRRERQERRSREYRKNEQAERENEQKKEAEREIQRQRIVQERKRNKELMASKTQG